MNKRKIGIFVILGLVILICVVIIIVLVVNKNNNQNNSPDISQSTTQEVKTPAQKSNLNINQYLDTLHSVIQNQYGDKLNGYEIKTGELLEDGSWYITIIQKPLQSKWDLADDAFRVVLHKENNQWKIVAGPNLILNYADYPDIPTGVIMSVNEYSPNQK